MEIYFFKALTWKNNLEEHFDKEWVGFCHYRRFWTQDSFENKDKKLIKTILQEAPKEWSEYDVVLREEVYVNSTKIIWWLQDNIKISSENKSRWKHSR